MSVAIDSPASATPDQVVYFDHTSPSSMVLQALAAGQLVTRVAVSIQTPFNGGSPTVELGTSGTPGLFLDTAQIDAKTAGQYEADEIEPFAAPDLLILAVNSSGSTAGAGFLLYSVR